MGARKIKRMKKAVKNKNIKISVITPSFNSGKYIERAIKSVIEQNYKNFEHIIIDGGSTDGTIETLKKFKHLKWISEPDKGQADAMNKGFKKNTGDVIVYLNADDYFFPEAFSSVIGEFKKGADFVMGNILVKSLRLGCEFINVPRTTLEGMLRHWEPNAFSHNSLGYFYTRRVQESCPFNSKNNITMDMEFLLDAASKFSFVKVEKVLGCFEDGVNTTTGKSQAKLDYWHPDMFPYMDKYLLLLSEAERSKFLGERRKGFALMQAHMNRLNQSDFKFISAEDLPLISVIMPTYNCAKYICRSIDSILSQELKNIEIIIIDDVSTDGTIDLLKRNYANNPLIKIISQLKNERQGVARNRGLDLAKGKYIFFMDSDDWIEKGCLLHLSSIAEKYNAEMVACGIDKVWEGGRSEWYHSCAFSCKGGREALYYLADYQIGSVVWNKLYLRQFIEDNKLRFITSYCHEDVMFTASAVYLCKKYISINDLYYKYFQRETSTINSRQSEFHLKSHLRLYFDMVSFIEQIRLCDDPEGEKLCQSLLKAHCSNEVFPRIVNYVKTRTASEWERECQIACCEIFGVKGYALASFMIDAMKQRDTRQVVLTEENHEEKTGLKKFIKKHFDFIVHSKLRRPLKRVYYAFKLNKFE